MEKQQPELRFSNFAFSDYADCATVQTSLPSARIYIEILMEFSLKYSHRLFQKS